MSKKELAKNAIEKSGGIIKTADLINAGLTKSDISNLTDNSFIERVKHGYYRLSGTDISEEQILCFTTVTVIIRQENGVLLCREQFHEAS